MASPTRRCANRPAPSSRPAPARIHTSYVAVRVQNKLKNAAAEPEWNLSRLVAHANTLDTLAIRMSDPDRKKKHEEEDLAAQKGQAEQTESSNNSQPPPSPLRRSMEVSRAEEEEAVHHSDDSTDEDDSHDSDEGWSTTEPSTALEQGNQTDYFGSVGESTQQASQDQTKLPTVVVAAATPEISVDS